MFGFYHLRACNSVLSILYYYFVFVALPFLNCIVERDHLPFSYDIWSKRFDSIGMYYDELYWMVHGHKANIMHSVQDYKRLSWAYGDMPMDLM